jgi:predicted small lipoprotein YifL
MELKIYPILKVLIGLIVVTIIACGQKGDPLEKSQKTEEPQQ